MIGEKTDLSFGYHCKRHIHKRRTLQRSDGYIYKEKRRTLVEFEKKANAIRNKIFKTQTYCEKNQRQLNKVSSCEGSTV